MRSPADAAAPGPTAAPGPAAAAPGVAAAAPAGPAAFFAGRRAGGGPGLGLFLNAGDPPLPVLADVVAMLDERRVDCLELAVPFPDSVTDGPVIRASAGRALARGVTADAVLGFVAAVRPRLAHLRIALLADFHHTVRPAGAPEFLRRVHGCGADGVLVHGAPPRWRPRLHETSAALGLPVVATCYATSPPAVVAQAAREATAFVYLVAHYGRSGTAPAPDHAALTATLAGLRARTGAPVAVGFGVRDGRDVAAVGRLGADAALVGSAAVSHVAHAQAVGGNPVDGLERFVHQLRAATT
ncbi:MAG TPA: tryptophan synthase subunit alpha [Pilimelia sp.]|nr:tryptophan synthase subunit alpha [Pilimelia sp.]